MVANRNNFQLDFAEELEDSKQNQDESSEKWATRNFAAQALLYCLVFFITWIFAMAAATINEFMEPPKNFWPTAFLGNILSSLPDFSMPVYTFGLDIYIISKREGEKEAPS